jgi:D-erythritol 1-phosphate dehydrogenase
MLGEHFGGLLYEREAQFLCETEWAQGAEDILERRTKHGLHLTPEQKRRFQAWLAEN